MHAHLVQLDIAWEDRAENYRRTRALLEGARGRINPGDLVVLPEMFDTGFSLRAEVTADRDGATLAFLREVAREFKVTLQGARTVLNPANPKRGLNRASIIAPDGSILAEYDKIHPFSFGKEPEHFDGGSRVLVYRWEAPGGTLTVCPSICYDLRFPELYREGLRQGAEVFALGANWPTPRKIHRVALGVARAIENQAYVICVNRAGNDPHLHYAGESYAVDPKGTLIMEAGDASDVFTVPIDPAAVRSWREQFPAWKDRRL
jgi:predicted amidohydrolase